MHWFALVSHCCKQTKFTSASSTPEPEIVILIISGGVVAGSLNPSDIMIIAHIISEFKFSGYFKLNVFLAGTCLSL
jgi:hypothetical protein